MKIECLSLREIFDQLKFESYCVAGLFPPPIPPTPFHPRRGKRGSFHLLEGG